MSKWVLYFTPEAKSDLAKLDKKTQRRIIEKIEWFQANFDNVIPSALGGEWNGYFKFRIGDWRVIYRLDWPKNKIVIYLIDRRDKIYKR